MSNRYRETRVNNFIGRVILELYLVIRTAVSWWDGWASSRTFWVVATNEVA